MDLDFNKLAAECAPEIALETITAIVRTESNFDPIALHVNGATLDRRPGSLPEAIAWANDLIARGYSVDVGLAQINSKNFERLHLTAERAFDPCTNLKAAQSILAERYAAAATYVGEGQEALGMALSAYNTGSTDAGYANGYVQTIAANAGADAAPLVPAIGPAFAITPTVDQNKPTSNPLIVFVRSDASAGNGQPIAQEAPIRRQSQTEE